MVLKRAFIRFIYSELMNCLNVTNALPLGALNTKF